MPAPVSGPIFAGAHFGLNRSPSLSPLLESAARYMCQGLSKSTLNSYKFSWSVYSKFCAATNISLFPVSCNSVCAFIVHCFDVLHFKPSYIRSLLAGVQFHLRCLDPSLLSVFSLSPVKLLLKGIFNSSPQLKDKRRPITLELLHRMLSFLSTNYFSPYVSHLLSSVFLLAFYGLLRISEFTSSSLAFDPSKHVAFSDLTFYPEYFNLHLKHSKGKGACNIIIARLSTPFCPFKAMSVYVKQRIKRASPHLPLFLTPEGTPMTSSWFLSHFHTVLQQCNLSPSHYSGHSFRIGGATAAASRGLSSASLQQLGRWSSSAFSAYIRPDSTSILSAQRSISA